MRNIRLTLAYDGGAYLGWQKTKMGPSIEETLQSVLEKILNQKIHLQAASRTDAGVHALGQVVNFLAAHITPSLDRLLISLNQLLPKDITILEVVEASSHFHPTLDVKAKEYRYYLCYGKAQLPMHRHFSWHYPYHALDIEHMRKAARYFIGKHNFAAFCNVKKNETYANYEREILEISIISLESHRLQISVKGVHFLYKMVRNIVGTLLYVGIGKLSIEEIPKILQEQDRTLAGMTAPAHGLFLHKIEYGEFKET